MTKFGKWVVMILLTIILVWPLTVGLYWIVYNGYAAMDRTKFPDLDPEIRSVMEKAPADIPDPDMESPCAWPFETGSSRK